jgi:tetratricopeptide (TPR) repeat protein
VSLGGYWPDYSCVRYYWYPSHAYFWYGYDPVAQEVSNDTYNYYTYNYYNSQDTTASDTGTGYTTGTTEMPTVDESTFADVREKLNRQQQQGPDAQTLADTFFDEGVKAFGEENYALATNKFATAMTLAPDDAILPFAYSQSLFAEGRYSEAADMLRQALQKSTPDKQGVYFPRGLYLDENILIHQIDMLAEATAALPTDSSLQLLLGYQQLGTGETEKSIGPLNNANADYNNSEAATMLLNLAEKIKAGENQ